MLSLFEGRKRRVEEHITEAIRGDLPPQEDRALFAFAQNDAQASEKTGYSNYSYWRSTFSVFFHNHLAITMLAVLVLLLLFTVIQPLLPGQYEANTVYNNPVTGMQLQNQAPSTTTTRITVPEGTILTGSAISEDWYAVTNVLTTLKARQSFTMLEYGEDWCKIECGGATGYVKNNFQTKLKLPKDDPSATPYESHSNFPLSVYAEPVDYTNGGDPLYAEASKLSKMGNGQVRTMGETALHSIPSENPFLFGTNNIGQDLWARVWSGTRTSLWIGFVVAFFEAFIGIIVGVIWGYVRKVDRLITEIYNVLDNIPTTIILILVSYIMRPGIRTLIFAMSLTRWLGMARFIRNQIVIIRDRDYNLASRCLGTGSARIMVRNLLPYLVSVIMLRMSLAIPGAIGSEVFITYIGLGLPVDVPSLGNLINEGRKLISSASLRYQLFFPAIVLSVITISFYIIGNSFADAADPKNHT